MHQPDHGIGSLRQETTPPAKIGLLPVLRTENAQRLADLVFLGVLAVVAGMAGVRYVLPYLTEGVTFTFRQDNFFSYSSGMVRRALPGEIIYRLDLLTGIGPQIFTGLMLTLWLFFLGLTTFHFRRTATPLEQIFVYLSSFYLLHSIDAEIFILLPFLGILFFRGSAAAYGVLGTIVLAGLIREVTFLLFAPVLLGFLLSKRWPLVLSTLVVTGAATWLLVFYSPLSSYALEFEYWPDRGISRLVETNLYSFVHRPLGNVLTMHVTWISDNILIIAPALIFFFGYAAMLIHHRRGSPALVLMFFGTVSVLYVLTFDHGRYFYILFMFLVLMTTNRGRTYFEAIAWQPPPLSWFGALLDKSNDRARSVTALLFALAPSGEWVGTYQPLPRAVRVALRAAGLA